MLLVGQKGLDSVDLLRGDAVGSIAGGSGPQLLLQRLDCLFRLAQSNLKVPHLLQLGLKPVGNMNILN